MHTYIIAECGVNHNGNVKTALKMVDAAKDAGCDCVKFQTFKAENLVTLNAPKAKYQLENTNGIDSQFQMLKKLELDDKCFQMIYEYCRAINIDFMSTPFDIKSVDLLEDLGVKIYKMSSGDITNKQLLQYVAKKNKPMIISTGMSTLEEVREAVDWIEQVGNSNINILHCTSNYPTSYDDVNMKAMLTLKKEFSYPIGYSDHTNGWVIPVMAVAMGAKIIEKHFTLNKEMEGPDHKASLDTDELKNMVDSIRIVERAMGNGIKKPFESEISTRDVARKSIVLACGVKKGNLLTKDNMEIKRPGTGIPPKYIDELVGRTIRRDMGREEILKWEDIV